MPEEQHKPFDPDSVLSVVMGRGRGTPHRHTGPSTVPIVGVGYFFIASEGVQKRRDLPYPISDEGESALLVDR